MNFTFSLYKDREVRPLHRLISVHRVLMLCLAVFMAGLLLIASRHVYQELTVFAAMIDSECCPAAKELKQYGGSQLSVFAVLPVQAGQPEETARQNQTQSQDTAKKPAPEDDSKDDATKPKWHSLFNGKTLEGWKISKFGGEGEAKVVDGVITIEAGVTLSGITCTQEVPKIDYEIEYEAKRTKGLDFFGGLTFPYGDTHCSFIAAGWGGSITGLSSIDDMDASENNTTTFQKFEQNQWYKFRVRVTKDAIQCWIDDKQVVDQKIGEEKVSIRPEVERSKPLGFSTWQSSAALRNIRWRNLKAED